MEALFISFIVIATAEIGDKTQLLALLLATRFRKPIPIILGMFCALLLGHIVWAGLGNLLSDWLKGNVLHWILGFSLLGAAVWAWIPEKIELDEKEVKDVSHHNIFLSTFISFILAEMGDKTQIATAALAAQFHSFVYVVIGSTLGMLAVNVPVILLSHAFGDKLPMRMVKLISGGIFACLGIYEISKVFTGRA
jgi:putative Ca2+/H+ antiporter (TMEM165/GDT1 family)